MQIMPCSDNLLSASSVQSNLEKCEAFHNFSYPMVELREL